MQSDGGRARVRDEAAFLIKPMLCCVPFTAVRVPVCRQLLATYFFDINASPEPPAPGPSGSAAMEVDGGTPVSDSAAAASELAGSSAGSAGRSAAQGPPGGTGLAARPVRAGWPPPDLVLELGPTAQLLLYGGGAVAEAGAGAGVGAAPWREDPMDAQLTAVVEAEAAGGGSLGGLAALPGGLAAQLLPSEPWAAAGEEEEEEAEEAGEQGGGSGSGRDVEMLEGGGRGADEAGGLGLERSSGPAGQGARPPPLRLPAAPGGGGPGPTLEVLLWGGLAQPLLEAAARAQATEQAAGGARGPLDSLVARVGRGAGRHVACRLRLGVQCACRMCAACGFGGRAAPTLRSACPRTLHAGADAQLFQGAGGQGSGGARASPKMRWLHALTAPLRPRGSA
jgi:hypothetical protein